MNELGARIRSLREKAGLSKAALARRVGVSDVTISYWESGTIQRVGHSRLAPLARALGCNVTYLLGNRDAAVEENPASTHCAMLALFALDHSPRSLHWDVAPMGHLPDDFLPEPLRRKGDHLLIPEPGCEFSFCSPGCFILAKTCERFRSDGLYLIEYQKRLIIARVERRDGHTLALHDDQRHCTIFDDRTSSDLQPKAFLAALWQITLT